MKIKCYYRKNLKLTAGKLGAQVGHVCKELMKRHLYQTGFVTPFENWQDDKVIVLALSDKKWYEMVESLESGDKVWHIQIDNGVTEIEKGTPTVVGFIEQS